MMTFWNNSIVAFTKNLPVIIIVRELDAKTNLGTNFKLLSVLSEASSISQPEPLYLLKPGSDFWT